MAKKSESNDALLNKQRKTQLQWAWRAVILVVVAYTLAKYFKVPLPF
jgi:hypothetical protein